MEATVEIHTTDGVAKTVPTQAMPATPTDLEAVRQSIATELGATCFKVDLEITDRTDHGAALGTVKAWFEAPNPAVAATVMTYPLVTRGSGYICGHPVDGVTPEKFGAQAFPGFAAIGTPSRESSDQILFIHYASGFIGALDVDPSYLI